MSSSTSCNLVLQSFVLFIPPPNSIFHSFQRFPFRLAQLFPVVQFDSAFASLLKFLFRIGVGSYQYAILNLIIIAVIESSWRFRSSYCSSSMHFNQILRILPHILKSSLICVSCAFFICFVTRLFKILISITSLCAQLLRCSDTFSSLCLAHVIQHISCLMMLVL